MQVIFIPGKYLPDYGIADWLSLLPCTNLFFFYVIMVSAFHAKRIFGFERLN
jgi:hypothetical protein